MGIRRSRSCELPVTDVDGDDRRAPAWSRQSVNPPVEAPASRHRRPSTSMAKRSSAACSFSPPRLTNGDGPRQLDRIGRCDQAGRLVGHGPADQDEPALDEVGGLRSAGGQPSVDEDPIEALSEPGSGGPSVARAAGRRCRSRTGALVAAAFLAAAFLAAAFLAAAFLAADFLAADFLAADFLAADFFDGRLLRPTPSSCRPSSWLPGGPSPPFG